MKLAGKKRSRSTGKLQTALILFYFALGSEKWTMSLDKKTKIGSILLILILLILYFNNLIYSGLQEILIVLVYLLICGYLYIKKENLHELYLDRTAILLFIGSSVFSLFRVNLLYSLVIVVSSAWTGYIIITRASNIKKTDWSWVGLSIFYTILVIVPATIIVLTLVQNKSFAFDKDMPNVLGIFVFSIGLSAALEEIFFRCLLWGNLQSIGIQLKYSFFIQFVLFWFLHYKGIALDPGFFILLPLEIFTSSFLAYKSKQTTPSIISHGLYNTIIILLWRVFV